MLPWEPRTVALLVLLCGACDGAPQQAGSTPVPASQPEPRSLGAEDLRQASGVTRFEGGQLAPAVLGQPSDYPGYTVRPVSYEVVPGFRSSAALWLPEGPGPYPGVVVLPGHFGEGKASGESQGVAHALAARGVAALALDMPGVEEWESSERQIHFEAGAFQRAALVAAGSSALGLQLHMARRGVDTLEELASVDRIAATGASGGAVLAFYLALLDDRVRAVALASPVGMPRRGDEGGCYCDVLMGHDGATESLLGALEALEGPHSYTAEMMAVALPWLDRQLAHRPPDAQRARQALERPQHTPGAALRSATDEGAMSILALAAQLGQPTAWEPAPVTSPGHALSCEGAGPAVILAGAGPEDVEALRAAGRRRCSLSLPADETWEARAFTGGHALVDRPASALAAASASLGGAPVYAVGPWAIAAGASGVPWVARAPLRGIDELDPAIHPPWVQVPGLWWGGLEQLYDTALVIDEDPLVLVEVLGAQR
jgi:dienelactone hydrolase